MGRVAKDFTYGYNLASGVTSMAYPTGRTITYSYSTAAQPTSAIDSGSGINYATGALYTAAGGLSSLTNGASLVSTYFYNNRLQPCRISVKFSGSAPANCGDTTNTGNVLDFTYGFNSGTANNGNVMQITNNRNTARSQLFTYDELNRLASAQTTSNLWGNTYVYDIWGNLLQKNQISGKTDGEFLQQTVNANNQIVGLTFDAVGNQTNDGSGLTFSYDAENRTIAAGGVTYSYDGDGKRVKKSNGKLYWYGVGSDPLTETDLSGTPSADFIFFNGKRTARLDANHDEMKAGSVAVYGRLGLRFWRTTKVVTAAAMATPTKIIATRARPMPAAPAPRGSCGSVSSRTR